MDLNDLDHESPLGDGTADTSTTATCPYCSETVEISVDPGGGSNQQYIEDCEVCCNPRQVTVHFINGAVSVQVTALE